MAELFVRSDAGGRANRGIKFIIILRILFNLENIQKNQTNYVRNLQYTVC